MEIYSLSPQHCILPLFYLLWSMSQRLKQAVKCCTENAASWLFIGALKLFSHCFSGFRRKVFKLQPKLFFPWFACPCQNMCCLYEHSSHNSDYLQSIPYPYWQHCLVIQGLELLLTVMIYVFILEWEKLFLYQNLAGNMKIIILK